MSIEELKTIDSRIGKDVLAFLDLRASMNSRDSQGGTATSSTKDQIKYYKKWLEENL
jgi:argininosuccinate lyase